MPAQPSETRRQLAALVFRAAKGCGQYVFATADELEAWAARHPYRNETLHVMPVKDMKCLPAKWLPAAAAAAYVRAALQPGALDVLAELEAKITADYERAAGGPPVNELDATIRKDVIADAARRVMAGEHLAISSKGNWVSLEWNTPNQTTT